MIPKTRSERQTKIDLTVDKSDGRKATTNDELWTKKEVASFLKLLNERAVLKLPIKRVRLGARTIRWWRSDAEAYAAQRTEQAA